MTEPCPCCGYLVFRSPGDDAICPICFWENDLSQLRFAKSGGGANKVSLVEAQQNYHLYGATELRFIDGVRPPNETDVRDPAWRPIKLDQDDIEDSIPGVDNSRTYPRDKTQLYYWRDNYWRKRAGA